MMLMWSRLSRLLTFCYAVAFEFRTAVVQAPVSNRANARVPEAL